MQPGWQTDTGSAFFLKDSEFSCDYILNEHRDLSHPADGFWPAITRTFHKFRGAHAPSRVAVGASPTVSVSTGPTMW